MNKENQYNLGYTFAKTTRKTRHIEKYQKETNKIIRKN